MRQRQLRARRDLDTGTEGWRFLLRHELQPLYALRTLRIGLRRAPLHRGDRSLRSELSVRHQHRKATRPRRTQQVFSLPQLVWGVVAPRQGATSPGGGSLMTLSK